MEHQSSTRPEPFPADVQEFVMLPEQESEAEQHLQGHLAGLAIDYVRSSGWWNYDGDE